MEVGRSIGNFCVIYAGIFERGYLITRFRDTKTKKSIITFLRTSPFWKGTLKNYRISSFIGESDRRIYEYS